MMLLFDIIFNLKYLIQNIAEYKSTLPNLLCEMINEVIKFDKASTLVFDFIKYPIDKLIDGYTLEKQLHIWIFIDFLGDQNIIQIVKKDDEQTKDIEKMVQQKNLVITSFQEYISLEFSWNKYYQNKLSLQKIRKVSQIKINNLDLLKKKAETNCYFTVHQFLEDFYSVFAWNYLYRTQTKNSIKYISSVFNFFLKLLNRTNFAKRFQEYRSSDFERLLKYQLDFKIQSKDWPSIPTQFREYQQILEYKPVPQSRKEIINRKLESKKIPAICPKDCQCLSQNYQCDYSLVQGTWMSNCQNRKNKIQCNHDDIQEFKKCKNSEIKKNQRKICKKQGNQEGNFDIEESLIWGIDYFTRKNIYYLLPQYEITKNYELKDNSQKKINFIQKSLLKSINFQLEKGYDIEEALKFIIKNSPKTASNYNLVWKYEIFVLESNYMFSNLDSIYAEDLLKAVQIFKNKQAFRIHSKGKGAKCLNPKGIKKSQFITQYFGELYETWRWYQKQDSTKRFMKELKMKQTLPDFYNIYLQKHKDQIDGYDILVVDPINKGNFSSRFSHSCNPNCGTITTVSDGKYYIAMYALRSIQYGEELTFDYCSMTQSNHQHQNAICLCGTKLCRGYYLQLGNSKMMNVILDKSNCFQNRTSVLLKSLDIFNEKDRQLCAKYNIKNNILNDCPQWLKKWTALIIEFLQYENEQYKKYVLENYLKARKKKSKQTEEQNTQKEQLYAEVYKNDLFQIRYQNLITTLDKLKYFLNEVKDQNPPIYIQSKQIIFDDLWGNPDASIIRQLKKFLEQNLYTRQVEIIEKFESLINNSQKIQQKLFLVRYAFLYLSHKIKNNTINKSLQNVMISDILYFYAFTHTYFTVHQYKSVISDQVVIPAKEILNFSFKKFSQSIRKKQYKQKKNYPSQFVWGQIASWFKQTIVQPQASLSQDRRGTLSYPKFQTVVKSNSYPFDGNTRANFLRTIEEKPYASWPPQKCQWSYKNTTKLYGTFLFESFYNAQKLQHLNQQQLLHLTEVTKKRVLIKNVIKSIDDEFYYKLSLFMKVQGILYQKNQDQINNLIKKSGMNYAEQEIDQLKREYQKQTVSDQKMRGRKKQKINHS